MEEGRRKREEGRGKREDGYSIRLKKPGFFERFRV
jgi:hypothetical protein